MSEQTQGDRQAQSGWRQRTDADGTIYVEITLTAADQRELGPYTMQMLRQAGQTIQAAFSEPD